MKFTRFYVEASDFRQMYSIAQNEIFKFVKGKRFLVYGILMAVIFGLVTFLPYVFGSNPGDTPGKVVGSYLGFADGLALIAATLFASTVIVSEFEERTALILFTRPVKKTTIFLGKFAACFVLEAFWMIVYYGLMCIVSLALAGGIAGNVGISLGVALAYLLAASSVAILISSLMKKSSVCTVVTFLVLLLVIPLISTVIANAGNIDTWFMLSTDPILYCVPDYVDQTNAMFKQMQEAMGVDMSGLMAKVADSAQAIMVDLAWALVVGIAAWLAFLRREF